MLFHAIAYNTRQYTILYNAMQYHLICKASHYGTLGAEKDVIEISSSVTNILYIHLLQAMSSLAYARKTLSNVKVPQWKADILQMEQKGKVNNGPKNHL